MQKDNKFAKTVLSLTATNSVCHLFNTKTKYDMNDVCTLHIAVYMGQTTVLLHTRVGSNFLIFFFDCFPPQWL